MDTVTFQQKLEAGGVSREAADAIVSYVADQKADLVTNQKLELELSKLGGDLRREMAELRGELRREMTELRWEVRRAISKANSHARRGAPDADSGISWKSPALDKRSLSDSSTGHTVEDAGARHLRHVILGSHGFLAILVIALRFLPAS